MNSGHAFVEWIASVSPGHFERSSRAIILGKVDEKMKHVFKGTTALDNEVDADVVWFQSDIVSKGNIASNTIASAYNAVAPGGLFIATFSKSSDEDFSSSFLESVFEQQGVALEDAFYDYFQYRTESDGAELFVGVKYGDDAAFLPMCDRDGVELVKKHSNRDIMYVACMSVEECEEAEKGLRGCQGVRIALVPTSWWGHHLSYAHVLPSLKREWIHADLVGVVSWNTDVPKLLGTRPRDASAVSCPVVSNGIDTGNIVELTTKDHPEFSKVWEWVLPNLGYKELTGNIVPVIAPGSWWMTCPAIMEAYCNAFCKLRSLLDGVDVPDLVRASLWSVSGRDDPHLSQKQKLSLWGTEREPYHRLIAEKFASFFFWIRCLPVCQI